MNLVDDHGRYDCNARLLASECFPYGDERGEPLTAEALDGGLKSLAGKQLLCIYESDQKHYIQLNRWKERKRSASKFPSPLTATMIYGEFVDEDGHVRASAVTCAQVHAPKPKPKPCSTADTPTPIASGRAQTPAIPPVPKSKDVVEAPRGDFVYAEHPEPGKDVISAFERFWAAYPKKKARVDAERAFIESGAHLQLSIVLAAVVEQSQSREWTKDRGEYIPLAGNWLRNRRWEDINGAQQAEDERLIRELTEL